MVVTHRNAYLLIFATSLCSKRHQQHKHGVDALFGGDLADSSWLCIFAHLPKHPNSITLNMIPIQAGELFKKKKLSYLAVKLDILTCKSIGG